MTRSVVLGLAAVLFVGSAIASVLRSNASTAPLPSPADLRTDGFAVWPEDTVQEGMEACREAETWRLDPLRTAFRFTRDVLEYPAPTLNAEAGDVSRQDLRFIIGSEGVRGVFLGSVIDVRKYGRCWFVVRLQPREGGYVPSVRVTRREGDPQIVLQSTADEMRVGYGRWARSIRGGSRVVLDLPALEPDATGHVMALSRYRQVFDGSATPLGFLRAERR
jgi:hypothetical protein